MSNIAQDTVNSLLATLQSVAELNGKTFHILSEAELQQRAKLVTFPAAGVIYEGMRGRPTGGATHKTGLAATLNATIIVFYKSTPGIGDAIADTFKPKALATLDTIRKKIRDTKAPSGYTWEFLGEMPALEKDGIVVWIQRWQVPVMLT